MEQKHFVMVSTERGKFNIGAMQHNQSIFLNNISMFMLRMAANIRPYNQHLVLKQCSSFSQSFYPSLA